MATVRPFQATRPAPQYANQVAALPYDVMGSDEAREMAKGNPYSFLHVDKAEIDLDPAVPIYDDRVYAKARENLLRFVEQGVLVPDGAPCFYIYKLVMAGRPQVGLVGCAAIDDYQAGIIKKHEFTRADKEEDRIRHVDTLNANTGPIFLACKEEGQALSRVLEVWMAAHTPVCDFIAEDDIGHAVWVVDDPAAIGELEALTRSMPSLYIADGHHRCASAVKVGLRRREANPGHTGKEEYNFFLSVIFPADQLAIMDYNRLVRDLAGLSREAFLERVTQDFAVEPARGQVKPAGRHTFGMCLEGEWFRLTAKPHTYDDTDPVACLDVSVLQNNLLGPVLGIADPRTDKRVDFVGGIRGLGELETRVRQGWAVAFSLYPTTMGELMSIADAGLVMPPKSTWFEPKLRSGLFIHYLG